MFIIRTDTKRERNFETYDNYKTWCGPEIDTQKLNRNSYLISKDSRLGQNIKKERKIKENIRRLHTSNHINCNLYDMLLEWLNQREWVGQETEQAWWDEKPIESI